MTTARLFWLALALWSVAQDRAARADPEARAMVERSRAAVAGAPDLRSLRFLGRIRIPQEGSTFDEGRVDIRVLLPDRYLRLDTFAASVTPHRDQAFFTRFMLGAVAYPVPRAKLTFRSTGEAAFDETVAVDATGPGFSGRLVFDQSSLVPLRLTFFPSGTVSMVTSFADRRPAGGLLPPFRVSTQTTQRVLEVLLFDEILVNPPLTDADFRP